MEIKKTTSYSYRIEPKPGGGFVAHPSDSSMETLEAATKEEILQRIQERIDAKVAKQFPGIQELLHADPNVYNLEAKPGGGFIAHPPNSSMATIEGATQEEVLQKIGDNIGAALERAGLPGANVVHTDLNLGGLHLSIDRKVKITTGTRADHTQPQQAPTDPAWSQPSFSQNRFSSGTAPQTSDSMGPILPAKDNSAVIWRVIAALLFLGLLAYFLLRH